MLRIEAGQIVGPLQAGQPLREVGHCDSDSMQQIGLDGLILKFRDGTSACPQSLHGAL
jgi:hypothetical protein